MSEMKFDMSRRRGRARGDGRDRAARPARSGSSRVIGATENMRRGTRVKPGDIVRAQDRHDDRDHQHRRRGPARARRLPRARASTQGAERLVDLATLTGAIVAAFGATLRRADGQRRRRGRGRAGRRRRDRRAGLAAAAAPRVRRADQGPLRRHRQRRRGPQGAARSRPRSSCAASPATCRGRTSTSPARRTTPAAVRAQGRRRASACGMLVELARANAGAPDMH